MKRIYEALLLIAIVAGPVYAIDPTLYNGNYIDGFAVIVTSWQTKGENNQILTSTAAVIEPNVRSNQYSNSGYIISNLSGGHDVWLDNSATITTTGGAGEGFKLSAGGTPIKIEGKNIDAIFGRTLAGDASWTTLYIFLTGQQ